MRAEKQTEACQFPYCSLPCPFFVFFGKCSKKKTKAGWRSWLEMISLCEILVNRHLKFIR